MEDVIARLRASKEESTKRQEAEGFEHGQYWAKIRADYETLEGLSEIENVDDLDDPMGAFEKVWAWEEWEELGESEAFNNFLEQEEGIYIPMMDSPNYTRGFIKGAQSVFGQVKDKL